MILIIIILCYIKYVCIYINTIIIIILIIIILCYIKYVLIYINTIIILILIIVILCYIKCVYIYINTIIIMTYSAVYSRFGWYLTQLLLQRRPYGRLPKHSNGHPNNLRLDHMLSTCVLKLNDSLFCRKSWSIFIKCTCPLMHLLDPITKVKRVHSILC